MRKITFIDLAKEFCENCFDLCGFHISGYTEPSNNTVVFILNKRDDAFPTIDRFRNFISTHLPGMHNLLTNDTCSSDWKGEQWYLPVYLGRSYWRLPIDVEFMISS